MHHSLNRKSGHLGKGEADLETRKLEVQRYSMSMGENYVFSSIVTF